MNRSAVEDRDGCAVGGPERTGEPGPDEGVRGSGVLRRGCPPGPDGPDRLVRDHERERAGARSSGRGAAEGLQHRSELPSDDLLQPTGDALLQGLADTDDRCHPGAPHGGRLPRGLLVGLAEEVTPLGVPDQGEVGA